MDALTPYRIGLWWAGMAWGLAYLAVEPYLPRRSPAPVPAPLPVPVAATAPAAQRRRRKEGA